MKHLIVIAFVCAHVYYGMAQGMVSEKDKKFAKEAAQCGLMEVKLGELAQTNGSSEEVRSLGSKMVTDHTKANNELITLANSKGIELPTGMSDKGTKSYEKLSKKTGADFDKAYTKCMVKDHKKDICLFKKEAKKGNDMEMKQWASNTIPTLEHHKEMSKEACKAIKAKK